MTNPQKHMFFDTVTGTRIRKQMEAATEMELDAQDIKALLTRFPNRYRELAIALGIEAEYF